MKVARKPLHPSLLLRLLQHVRDLRRQADEIEAEPANWLELSCKFNNLPRGARSRLAAQSTISSRKTFIPNIAKKPLLGQKRSKHSDNSDNPVF